MSKQENVQILSTFEFLKTFPDDVSVAKYLEERRWPGGRFCPHCGSLCTVDIKNKRPMPFRCQDCREHFSIRTGTILAESKISLQKWFFAIYLMATTARKGISSMQLAKEIGVTQKTAWFLQRRIREAYEQKGGLLNAEVEIDKTYIGGKEKSKHAHKRLNAGRGTVGKFAVLGMKERGGKIKAFPIKETGKIDLHTATVENAKSSSSVYTDCRRSYVGIKGYTHFVIKYSVGEYAKGQVHTNGIESFWALLKRGYYGIFHHMSVKHLHRYVNEFSTRHNLGHDTISCLNALTDAMFGCRLTYKGLKAVA